MPEPLAILHQDVEAKLLGKDCRVVRAAAMALTPGTRVKVGSLTGIISMDNEDGTWMGNILTGLSLRGLPTVLPI